MSDGLTSVPLTLARLHIVVVVLLLLLLFLIRRRNVALSYGARPVRG